MKSSKKYNMFLISMLGIAVGRGLSRLLSIYFGYNGYNIVASGGIAIVFCAIVILIVKRHYFIALISLIISVPLVVGLFGMYIDNIDIVGLSILLMFIIYPVLAIVIPRLRRNKN